MPLSKEQVVAIARHAHEANRIFCETVGDSTQKTWERCAEWQKASAVAGVEYVIANPQSTSAELHDNWCRDKTADGWQWGDKKDEVAKTHPSLVPYDELPLEQRLKDLLFSNLVKSAIFIEEQKNG